jgi:CDP-paratose 2-epimerase
MEKTKGQVFNIGGGKDKVISVWEDFRPILEKLYGKKIEVTYGDWRPGDQKIYVSDIKKAKEVFGWEPRIKPEEGIEKLFNWVKENIDLFK